MCVLLVYVESSSLVYLSLLVYVYVDTHSTRVLQRVRVYRVDQWKSLPRTFPEQWKRRNIFSRRNCLVSKGPSYGNNDFGAGRVVYQRFFSRFHDFGDTQGGDSHWSALCIPVSVCRGASSFWCTCTTNMRVYCNCYVACNPSFHRATLRIAQEWILCTRLTQG